METSKLTENRIKEYLKEGKRFDGRKPEEFRDIVIETDVSKNAESSCRVKLGKTEVIVGVKLNAGTPYPDSPDKGNLMVTAELLPLSSPRFENGPPKFPAIELGRVTDRGIRESKIIELDKLCIKEGEKVWTIFIDIYSINDDGNLMDAAGIGALVALKNAKIPKYDEKTEQVLFGEWTDKKLPLKKDLPISLTAYKIGEHIVFDPTLQEEDVSETRVTMSSKDGILHSMQKSGLKELDVEEFGKMLDLTTKVQKDIFKKIEKHLK